MNNRETSEVDTHVPRIEVRSGSTWIDSAALILWLAAGAVAFLPFAFNTSPWDAVTLRVPGNQGNWWHFLAGAPFFLAFPMIWVRLRSLFSSQPFTPAARRILWIAAGLSMAGTTLVEMPFLLHLAGTKGWPSFTILSVGFGIMISSLVLLFALRRRFSPSRACLAGLNTAYLANAALCLVVYAEAAGGFASRSGWYVCMVIVWPMLFELAWLFLQAIYRNSSILGHHIEL
ncbi:MAG: hypothetical protein WBD91_06405 [Acidobacteriaceae bacterium]